MTIIGILGISIAALSLLVLLWFITTYNRFVRLKSLLNEAWSGIDVQLKRRYDLVPNLIAVVKQYSVHEKSVIDNVVNMRAASMGAQSIEHKSAVEVDFSRALTSLFAIVENYPDLKANQNFIELQKELGALEQEIQLARRYYNGTVRNYNMLVETVPSNIVATIAQFKKAPYFELTSSEERENYKVTFE